MNKIYNLRNYFFIYCLVIVILDSTFIMTTDFEFHHIFHKYGSLSRISYSAMISIIVIGYLIVFALIMLVFYFAVLKKNWARLILLVIGWITIIDAISGFLFVEAYDLLEKFDLGFDWNKLLFFDRTKDTLSAIYYGFVIYILQFDNEVKKQFINQGIKD